MKKKSAEKTAFWFHLGIGILTLALAMEMAAFIFTQVQGGTFPWWTYPAFSAYVAFTFALDHVLFSRTRTPAEEKPCTVKQDKVFCVTMPPSNGFHPVSDTRLGENKGRI